MIQWYGCLVRNINGEPFLLAESISDNANKANKRLDRYNADRKRRDKPELVKVTLVKVFIEYAACQEV